MKTTLLSSSLTALSALLFTACQSPMAVALAKPIAKQLPLFPTMQVKNLNGEARTFPKDFPGKKTLLLIAFQRNQQQVLDDWTLRLALNNKGAAEWLELPIINDPGASGRWFIDNGMKRGIANAATRARVFTIYAPPETFVQHLGLLDAKQVHLAVANRKGQIIDLVSGNWTALKERKLRSALSKID